jgi:hypothetical protein
LAIGEPKVGRSESRRVGRSENQGLKVGGCLRVVDLFFDLLRGFKIQRFKIQRFKIQRFKIQRFKRLRGLLTYLFSVVRQV